MSRKGIQLAYPFEEKRLAKWKPPYIVQPKYDGERCRAVSIGEGKYMLLSSEENPFFSVPHITNALSLMGLDLELDGELYCHGMPFEEIHSIVSRTVNLHPAHEAITFHVFDYIGEETQAERITRLYGIADRYFNLLRPVRLAPSHICDSLEDIMRTYDKLLEKGYEGIIVRHLQAPYLRKRSIYMMKFKPKKEDDYEVIGWKEEISKDGVPKARLGALVCRGTDGTPFSVGSGLDDETRERLWESKESLPGRICKVQYQHLTAGKKVPRFPVFVSVVDEGE